jgi:hypothetical protein
MNRRDIVIGFVILALLAGFIYLRSQRAETPDELTVPQTLSVEDKFEEAFGVELPEDVERAELSDVTGGESSGIATRKFDNGRFTHTVLADLPDPTSGAFYEGWLVRGAEGDDNFGFISTGRMRIAKGGYLLEFESATDYSEYSGVVITIEKVADTTPEEHILEGSF